jgi:hypothetical protein
MGAIEKPAAGVWEIILEQKNRDGTFNKEKGIFLENRMKHQTPVPVGLNPYHYVIVRVDGDKLDMKVISVD